MSNLTFFKNLIEECKIECNTRGKMISDNMGELLAQKFAETFDEFGYTNKLPNIVTLFEDMFSESYPKQWFIGVPHAIVSGKTYIVIFNGTQYQIEFQSINGTLTSGNLSIKDLGEDTGEPFCVKYGKAAQSAMFYFKDSPLNIGGLHLSMYEIDGYIINPLPTEFLPTVPYLLMNSSTADSTKVFKLTVDDTGTLSATEVTSEEE